MSEKTVNLSTNTMKILMDLLETLKTITDSTEAHLYMTVNDKLYRVIKGHCTAYPTGWKPGPGTIPVAYVAHTKTFFTSNNGLEKEMFRYGVGRKNADADKILCIPIVDPKGRVFGVLELSRHSNDPIYTQEEIDMAVTISAWASSTIYRNATKTLINKDDLLLADFLFSLEKYATRSIDFSSYISQTMEYVQKNIGADGVIYSEILKFDPYIVIDYYKKDKDSPHLERSSKKRCLDDVNDAEVLYSLKTSDIYRRTELVDPYNTRGEGDKIYESVLCCPVFEIKKPAGVALLWKRDVNGGFTWYDELVTSNSLASLLIAYNLHRLSERNFMKRMMCDNVFDLVIYQLKPCAYDIIFLNKCLSSQPNFPENFFKFSYYPGPEVTWLELVRYCLDMLRIVLGEAFLHMNPRLGEFIIMVANNYRNMYYHNFLHAFTTMHVMFNVIIRNKDKIFPIEVVALMIATICHDMDHPGLSNAFLKLIDSYMWQLYEEQPTLEVHHSFFALYLIQHCQLFCYMKKDKYKLVMQKVKEHILATDLTNHFKVKSEMFEMLAENGFQWADPEHREGFKSILMTTCDLCGSFKNPRDAIRITSSLYGEFYAQGDLEKKRGVVPLSIMDRTMTESIPNAQVTFLTMISLPCFDMVKEIVPNCDEIVTAATRLLEFWKKMADETEPINISVP